MAGTNDIMITMDLSGRSNNKFQLAHVEVNDGKLLAIAFKVKATKDENVKKVTFTHAKIQLSYTEFLEFKLLRTSTADELKTINTERSNSGLKPVDNGISVELSKTPADSQSTFELGSKEFSFDKVTNGYYVDVYFPERHDIYTRICQFQFIW